VLPPVQRLKDQVALVTGASRGIGRAVALELASEGASVVVNYQSQRDAAEEVVCAITRQGGQAFAFQADVTREADVRNLVSFTLRQLGGLDLLVTNAGVVRDQLAASMTLEQWETVIQTNLLGVFLCIRAVLPHMMAKRSGSIIAISSIAAERGGRGHVNYAAAKGGINALTRSLAVELAPRGIRVNAVAPGVILTDMSKRIRNLATDEILAQIPLRRFGEPIDVARAVRFLASEEASYITGEVLHVSGGMGL
jgi:3-oxoacyl-[acyl-carrier protein] reductase